MESGLIHRQWFHYFRRLLKTTTGGRGKGKGIPVKARTDPEDSRNVSLTDSMTIGI